MPTPKRGPRLGSGPAHQKLMLANLASDLFRYGRIKTTHAKAKTLRPYAEKLITRARDGDLAARRQVQSKLRDRDVTAYLFDEVAPRFADRPGGYTRILKLGPRAGDSAPMAIIELVEQGAESGDEVIEESKEQRSRGIFGRGRRRKAEPAAAAPVDEASPGGEDVDEASLVDDDGGDEASLVDDDGGDEAPTTGPEEPGIEAQAPPQGPEDEPDAPDDPAVGDPVDFTDDDADAGEASGKDAGA